ncbi:hypothetical protein PENPOL_c012G05646 [Penicillium polonicum]|uniref:Protein kinase domain-containing protein n=1 Tax=Penicillium polonicum TaxID=60169 RepID=A0A1V6NCQ8_PENPO|nr:hypothetical protein PENPOL_c012G05646 [Penicillium polonicum]
MLSSLLRSLPQLGRRWKPLNFSNPNFVRIPEWHKIEEETLPDYIPSQYYPTRIAEVIKERYQVIVLAVVLYRLFLALDYLHTECYIAHTDIKADNIIFGIKDDSVFTDFEEYELQKPVLRKEVDADGRTIYISQELKIPKQVSSPILYDFGSAIHSDQYHSVFIQPQIYRVPEVILGVP